jgi:hypothetical protein
MTATYHLLSHVELTFSLVSGAELLFTSDEVSAPTDNQLATIHSVDSVSGIITLTSPLPKHLTSTEDSIASGDGALYGVEVAILTRRITFEPEDNTDLIGGHTIIFHTPDIAQNIQGVELRRFGQQGSVGRYPLHFREYIILYSLDQSLAHSSPTTQLILWLFLCYSLYM